MRSWHRHSCPADIHILSGPRILHSQPCHPRQLARPIRPAVEGIRPLRLAVPDLRPVHAFHRGHLSSTCPYSSSHNALPLPSPSIENLSSTSKGDDLTAQLTSSLWAPSASRQPSPSPAAAPCATRCRSSPAWAICTAWLCTTRRAMPPRGTRASSSVVLSSGTSGSTTWASTRPGCLSLLVSDWVYSLRIALRCDVMSQGLDICARDGAR